MFYFINGTVDQDEFVIGAQYYNNVLQFTKRSSGAGRTFIKTICSIGLDGDLSVPGNIVAGGTINGTNVASLVSLDDLKEVLSSEQIMKIEARVKQRMAVAKVEDIRQ